MKKILLVTLFCLVSCVLPATTIVIYVTPAFVIMAVDSKGIYTNAKTFKQTSAIVSKIYKTDDVYFSLAGLTLNSVRSFDVGKLTDANLKSSSNIKSAIDSIKLNVKAALHTYLSNQKKNNYKLFKKNIEAEAYVTSIGIISIKNSKPYAHIIGFRVKDGTNIKISAEEEIYDSSSKRDAVYYLGTAGEINKYMNSIQRNDLKPVPFVDKLKELQMAKTPEQVGPPIDMIKITSEETVWIRRKKSTPVEIK